MNLPGLPEHVHAVAYRKPAEGEFYMAISNNTSDVIINTACSNYFPERRLIVAPDLGYEFFDAVAGTKWNVRKIPQVRYTTTISFTSDKERDIELFEKHAMSYYAGCPGLEIKREKTIVE